MEGFNELYHFDGSTSSQAPVFEGGTLSSGLEGRA